jgi:hypothetical protein
MQLHRNIPGTTMDEQAQIIGEAQVFEVCLTGQKNTHLRLISKFL